MCDLKSHSKIFRQLSHEVGFIIKESKNKKGRVASFAVMEIPIENMII